MLRTYFTCEQEQNATVLGWVNNQVRDNYCCRGIKQLQYLYPRSPGLILVVIIPSCCCTSFYPSLGCRVGVMISIERSPLLLTSLFSYVFPTFPSFQALLGTYSSIISVLCVVRRTITLKGYSSPFSLYRAPELFTSNRGSPPNCITAFRGHITLVTSNCTPVLYCCFKASQGVEATGSNRPCSPINL